MKRTLFIVFLVSLMSPLGALAAISFEAVEYATVNNSSQTMSHTISGTDPFLFVCMEGDSGLTVSATWDGGAMTALDTPNDGAGNGIYAFYKVAPTIGTHDVVLTRSGSGAMRSFVASYAGTSQSAIDAHAGNNHSSASSYADPLTTGVSAWLIDCANVDAGATVTGSTGTTKRANSAGLNLVQGDSNADVGAGADALNWSSTGAGPWVSDIVSIAASAGGGGGGPAATSTEATSSVDRVQANFWEAWWTFFAMVVLMIWLGRSTK